MNKACQQCRATKVLGQKDKINVLNYRFVDGIGWQYESTYKVGKWNLSASCRRCPYELERMMADEKG